MRTSTPQLTSNNNTGGSSKTFSSTTIVTANNNTNASSPSTAGGGSSALQPYIFQRVPPNSVDDHDSSSSSQQLTLYSIMGTITGKPDLSPTFWVPDTSRGEYSLLAALVKRQSQHHSGEDYLPVAMRPDIELANNFSTYKGERIDLSGDKFKLSRATQTLSQLSASSPMNNNTNSANDFSSQNNNNSSEGMMRLSDVREGIRSGISMMQTDEYFLVKYRDYSEFAINRWSEDAQRERFMSPKYVEKYFAVRVGTSHGVFIPISETQFIRGTEILSTANMSAEAFANSKFAVSLNTDQFKAIGAPANEFSPQKENSNNSNNGNTPLTDDPDLDLPPPPHPLDFSAEAFNIRWRRFARKQYHSFGRMALKLMVVGATAYVIRQYYFNGGGNQQQQQITDNQHRRGRRNSGGRNSTSTAQVVRDVVSLPVNLAGLLLSRGGSSSRDDYYDE